MAVLNAVSAAIILGCIYSWISSIFKSRLIGLLAVIFYMGSGHFLMLSVINEDIMPSYLFVLIAMILASVWFGAPTIARIIVVALIFSVGWLFEWRLLFPVLPPMLFVLWITARGWVQAWKVSRICNGSMLSTFEYHCMGCDIKQFEFCSSYLVLRPIVLGWKGGWYGLGWFFPNKTSAHLGWYSGVFGRRTLCSIG